MSRRLRGGMGIWATLKEGLLVAFDWRIRQSPFVLLGKYPNLAFSVHVYHNSYALCYYLVINQFVYHI